MKKLLSYILVLFSTSVMMVACQPKDDGNKDQEITYARQAYDRCVQSRGQDACNIVRGGTVMSVKEYFGNTNATMGMGLNYGYGGYYNTGLLYGTQYTAAQVNSYFDNYLRRASKDEIVQMANQWSNAWGSMNGVNGFYTQPINSTRCTAYGC